MLLSLVKTLTVPSSHGMIIQEKPGIQHLLPIQQKSQAIDSGPIISRLQTTQDQWGRHWHCMLMPTKLFL